VVIVGHDARLTDVADRVLWLEDGAFRSISDMATDPLCGIAVGRQRTPHVVHDGTTWYFCSPECREEFVRYPMRFIANMATAREEHAERRWGTCRTPS